MIKLKHEICFLIVSHSKNLDVIAGLKSNFSRFKFKINNGYILSNNKDYSPDWLDFSPINVKKSSWKGEIIEACKYLKSLGYNNVILYLDDFYLIENIDYVGLNYVLNNIGNKKYIRLSPSEGSLCSDLCVYLRRDKLQEVNISHPYYSSLQTAIWDLDYLIDKCGECKNIWHFEHLKSNEIHWFTKKTIFKYSHSVEKSRWKYYSKKKFPIEFLSINSSREIESPYFKFYVKDMISKIKFKLFGYINFKIINK